MKAIANWKEILRCTKLVGGELQIELAGYLFRGIIGSTELDCDVLIFKLSRSVHRKKDSPNEVWLPASSNIEYSVVEGYRVHEENSGILHFQIGRVGVVTFFPKGTTETN